MEIRVLRYFLEVARQGSMTRAAETLHITQPTLSRQIKELEEELGKKLFKRGSTSMSLTSEGMLLRKRAEDILSMVDKTADEFLALDDVTGGEIYIGCAESYLLKYIADAVKEFRKQYPLFRYNLTSGDTEQVAEKLDRGLFDFAIIVQPPDLSKYNYLEIPEPDTWGLIMRKDHPLAAKEAITADDLIGIDLIMSRQSIIEDLPRWCGEKADSMNFSGTMTLAYNGSVFVKAGLGCMLAFDKLVDTGSDSELCFRPLTPPLENRMYIIWKKYQVFTPIAERFIEKLKEMLT